MPSRYRSLILTSLAFALLAVAPLACSQSNSVTPIDSGPPPKPDSAPPPDGGPVQEPDAHPDVQVTMNANNPSGTGANTQETYLNIDNVNAKQFGKLFARAVDGDQYAQPLYASGLKQKDGAKKNVVFVATTNDSVYAFDADDPTAFDPIWKVSVGTPSPMPNAYVGNHLNDQEGCATTPRFINQLGVISTPTLDVASGTLYVLAVDVDSSVTIPNWSCIYADPTQSNYCETYTCTAPSFRYRLHALDVQTGAEKLGGPVTISATVPGSGGGSSGGNLPFDPMRSFTRSGLLLANGRVYLAFSGYSDLNTYHGWVFGYDATTLKQTGAFCDSADGVSGGIWQGGKSLLADSAGNIYVVTGNGTFSAGIGGHDYGDSVLKLNPDLTEVVDYFSPFLSDYMGINFLAYWDDDLGSAGATMIPNTTLMLVTGKLGIGYLLDTGNLGKWNPTADKVVQKTRIAWAVNKSSCTDGVRPSIVYDGPIAWTGANAEGAVQTHMYVWAGGDELREYTLDNNGQFQSKGVCFCTPDWPVTYNGENYDIDVPDPPCGVPHSQGAVGSLFGGGAMSISSNGTARGTGLLWVTHAASGNPNSMSSPGVIEAYDATFVGSPLWSSAMSGLDALGNWAKFNPPTIANGKVYVPTFSNQLVVYGLLGP
jgi:hypothetical protein